MKLPPIKDLSSLIKALKKEIQDDYRAYESFSDDEETVPSMLLTVGWSMDGSWDWQTGDNSCTGGAYLHRNWGVVAIYRRSNSKELAREIREQLIELSAYEREGTDNNS